MDYPTPKYSRTKKSHRKSFNVIPHIPSPDSHIKIPHIGRTLSYAEIRALTTGKATMEELPTAEDFCTFTALLTRNSYYADQPDETKILYVSQLQFVTALEEDNVLTEKEESVVRKVVAWLSRLIAQKDASK
jgi:hypothetical protein